MSVVKPATNKQKSGPSTFALLVDDISKMSKSEQKALWININQEKLSVFARTIDVSVEEHNLSETEIDALIDEAKKKNRSSKKG